MMSPWKTPASIATPCRTSAATIGQRSHEGAFAVASLHVRDDGDAGEEIQQRGQGWCTKKAWSWVLRLFLYANGIRKSGAQPEISGSCAPSVRSASGDTARQRLFYSLPTYQMLNSAVLSPTALRRRLCRRGNSLRMLDSLTQRLSKSSKPCAVKARLTEANSKEMLREVRLADR